MEQLWRVWVSVDYGAFEYVGEASGETFVDACQSLASSDPAFAADFNPKKLSLRGYPLVPIDRRIDGRTITFGEPRDAVADAEKS